MVNLMRLGDELERDEGFRSHVYKDSAEGYWTIGYGRMVDKRLGGGISKTEARFLLDNDVLHAIQDLDRNVPWWRGLPEPAMRGLANMAYNLGWTRLSGFKHMLAALKTRQFHKAAMEALDSKWARQVGGRAQRIARLFEECGE